MLWNWTVSSLFFKLLAYLWFWTLGMKQFLPHDVLLVGWLLLYCCIFLVIYFSTQLYNVLLSNITQSIAFTPLCSAFIQCCGLYNTTNWCWNLFVCWGVECWVFVTESSDINSMCVEVLSVSEREDIEAELTSTVCWGVECQWERGHWSWTDINSLCVEVLSVSEREDIEAELT